MILFFDTETTGIPDFNKPPEDAGQPRLVQLAALLTDDTGLEVASANLLIKPGDFDFPPGAVKAHGITKEHALACGVQAESAIRLFLDMWKIADLIVAHNVKFDYRIMQIEIARHPQVAVGFESGKKRSFCTMNEMTDICQCPPFKYGKWKWPKMQEAYKHAFGEEFANAHDAMADVTACAKVYFWLQTRKAVAA
jgi:DNA polymerase-3 subunit epsilon